MYVGKGEMSEPMTSLEVFVSSDKKLCELEYLWKEDKEYYVLLKNSKEEEDKNCLIVHVQGGFCLLVEDDDMANYLVANMRENGVPIVTIDELPKPTFMGRVDEIIERKLPPDVEEREIELLKTELRIR